MKLYFSEVNNLRTPRGNNSLVSLDTNYALEVCGRFAEGLLLNEEVTIPINSPALSLIVLIRWFGDKKLTHLINEGIINFSFYPGTFAYITKANKRALSLKADTGLNWFITQGLDNIYDAVRVALEEQLGYSSGKARRFSRRVAKRTKNFTSKELHEKVKKTTYKNAYKFLSNISPEIDNLKKLNKNENQKEIRQLLNISSVYLEFVLSSLLECDSIYGNNSTWNIINDFYKKVYSDKKLKDTVNKLNKILKFERAPNFVELVKMGWDIKKIIEIRNDSHIKEFRNWLKNDVPNSSDIEIVRTYYETIKDKTTEKLPVKVMRIGIPAVLSILGGPLGGAFGTLLSVFDGFFCDKLINGWNPHIFIEKHFKYYQKEEESN